MIFIVTYVVCTLGERKKELYKLLGSLEKQINKNFRVIVVAQDNFKLVREIISEFKDLQCELIESKYKGLSISRNLAIEKIKGGIIVFSDDDAWYPSNSVEQIINNTKDKEVVCYKYYDPDTRQYPKNYSEKRNDKLNKFQLLKISSIEISINLEKVNRLDLKFDERFGVGSLYYSGEENIFLSDLVDKGYVVTYVPEVIAYHPCKRKNNMLDRRYWVIKGPSLYRVFKNKGITSAILLVMTIRKFKRLKNPFRYYIEALNEMNLFIGGKYE